MWRITGTSIRPPDDARALHISLAIDENAG